MHIRGRYAVATHCSITPCACVCLRRRLLNGCTTDSRYRACVRGERAQFVEWWKKLLKALSKAGHAEAGAMAAVGTPNRSRSSKHHRAPPPSNLVAPKLADLVRLAVATLDDQREGDAETPLWRCVV